MSKLKRYHLLISWLQSATRYQHTLSMGPADASNNVVINECIRAWLFLLDDILQSSPESIRNRRLQNWLRSLFLNDFQDVISICKAAYSSLLENIQNDDYTYADFKGQLQCSVPGFRELGFFLSPVSKIISEYFSTNVLLDNGCFVSKGVRLLGNLSQFFSFPLKLSFTNMGLEDTALNDYLIAEAETAAWSINVDNHALATQVKSILTFWLKDFSYDGNKCQHGPGSVADLKDKSLLSKFRNIRTDKKLSIVMRDDGSKIDLLGQQAPLGVCKVPLMRCSKLVFVPKNVTKLRSISMEPVTLQYVQQGVQLEIRDYIDRHPYLSRIINLGDQTQNRSFAYDGSITNKYATIDLSHASDSVSWELVKYLFSAVPRFLKWLIVTRSNQTLLPNGVKIGLTKFAPMGSSLCFPVETLVFAAITEASLRNSRTKLQGSYHYSHTESKMSYSIYGDDIVIPTYAANLCVTYLKMLGFSPNKDKTYLSGPFKESCGGNFFCGYDITPIKFNPPWDNTRKHVGPETYMNLCSLVNLATEHSFPMLRLYLLKRILGSGLKPLFGSSTEQSPIIFSRTPTNFHLRMKEVGQYVLRHSVSSNGNSDRIWVPTYKTWEYTSIKVVLKTSFRGRLQRKENVLDRNDVTKLKYYLTMKNVVRRTEMEYNLCCKHIRQKLPMDLSDLMYNYSNTIIFSHDVRIADTAILPSTVVFNRSVGEVW